MVDTMPADGRIDGRVGDIWMHISRQKQSQCAHSSTIRVTGKAAKE